MSELLIILIIALLVFGPKHIPEFISYAKRFSSLWQNAIQTITEEIDKPPASEKENDDERH